MEHRKPGEKAAVFADKGWRLVRLWETMMLLAEHPAPMSATEINDRIHRDYPFNFSDSRCSVQTTSEDLKTLQKCGFPVCRFNSANEEVYAGAESLRGKFKNTRWGFKTSLMLGESTSPWLRHPSVEDIISLSLCRALLKDEMPGYYPLRHMISQLLDKLQIRLNKAIARGESLDVDLPGRICRLGSMYVGKSVPKETWKVVVSAIARRHVLAAKYKNRSGENSLVDISPIAVWFSEGRAYLLAAGVRDEKIRVWRMDRFLYIHEDKDRKASEFSEEEIEDLLKKSFKGFISGSVRVSIRVKPIAAYLFREFKYHASQQICEHEDGSLTVTMDCSAGWGFEEWLLGFGELVVVEKPFELRRRLAERIGRMAEEYRGIKESS